MTPRSKSNWATTGIVGIALSLAIPKVIDIGGDFVKARLAVADKVEEVKKFAANGSEDNRQYLEDALTRIDNLEIEVKVLKRTLK